MNRINLTGNLTTDPELRDTANGTKVCNIRLAVKGMGQGNEVGYIDVASYGASGEAAANVLKKGWLVGVTGRVEWRTWDKDGATRHAYSVVGNIEFLAAPKANNDTSPEAVAAGSVPAADEDISF